MFEALWQGVPLFFPVEEQIRRELAPILPAEEMLARPQVVADVPLVAGLAQLGLLPRAHKTGDAGRLEATAAEARTRARRRYGSSLRALMCSTIKSSTEERPRKK